MSKNSKQKRPKEIDEIIERQKKEDAIEQHNITQITWALELVGKQFVQRKQAHHISEQMAISWVITGCCNLMADLSAFAVSRKYVENLEDLTIASATQIHEMATKILEEHTKGKSQGPGSGLILPEGA